MNDSLEDLALELGRLKPGPTSARLNREVERALEPPSRPAASVAVAPWRLRIFRWAAAAVFVAAGGFLAVRWATPASGPAPRHVASDGPMRGRAFTEAAPTAEPALRSLGQTHYLIDAEDRGVIYPPSDTPWRKVNWHVLSVSEWRDEGTKSTIRVLVPREETVVIPVNFR